MPASGHSPLVGSIDGEDNKYLYLAIWAVRKFVNQPTQKVCDLL